MYMCTVHVHVPGGGSYSTVHVVPMVWLLEMAVLDSSSQKILVAADPQRLLEAERVLEVADPWRVLRWQSNAE